MTREYRVYDLGDNGEFLTFAELVRFEDQIEVSRETFVGNSEEAPGHSALELARSDGRAWEESAIPLEIRFAPYGPEWAREREEDREGGFVPIWGFMDEGAWAHEMLEPRPDEDDLPF
jgi:hypothetical protein